MRRWKNKSNFRMREKLWLLSNFCRRRWRVTTALLLIKRLCASGFIGLHAAANNIYSYFNQHATTTFNPKDQKRDTIVELATVYLKVHFPFSSYHNHFFLSAFFLFQKWPFSSNYHVRAKLNVKTSLFHYTNILP